MAVWCVNACNNKIQFIWSKVTCKKVVPREAGGQDKSNSKMVFNHGMEQRLLPECVKNHRRL